MNFWFWLLLGIEPVFVPVGKASLSQKKEQPEGGGEMDFAGAHTAAP